MKQPRVKVSAIYIGNGKVLVAGGFTQKQPGDTKFVCTNTCEVVKVHQRAIEVTDAMSVARAEFPLLLTKDSNVIAVSGAYNDAFSVGNNNLNTPIIELYNRSTGKWKVIGALNQARRQHAVTFINDDEMLIIGGRDENLSALQSCEIFNIKTGLSRFVADYPYPTCQVLCERTSDNNIIACAGRTGGSNSPRYNTVYNYNVANDKWIINGSLSKGVQGANILKLWNNHVVISGGATQDWGLETTNSIWQDNNGSMLQKGTMNIPRMQHESAQWSTDTVVFTGGWKDDYNVSLRSTEMYDVKTGTSIQVSPTMEPHTWHKMISIPTKFNSKGEILEANVIAISGINKMYMNNSGNATGFDFTPTVEILQRQSCSKIANVTGFQQTLLYGDATRTDNTLRLTDNESDNVGACWTINKVDVKNDFTCSFKFKLSKGNDNGIADGSEPGADGIAFVIQNYATDNPLRAAEYLGYDGLPNSLAVEFDTYHNKSNRNDPNGNHIAIQSNGTKSNSSFHSSPITKAITTAIPILKNDSIYCSKIEYNSAEKTLAVYLDVTDNFDAPVVVATNIDIPTLLHLDNEKAWVGFTGSTGTAWSYQEILEWKIERCLPFTTSAVEDVVIEGNNRNLTLYPQPSQQYVNIIPPDSFKNITDVRVFDVLGNVVAKIDCSLHPITHNSMQWIPGSEVANGVYVIQVSNGTQMISASVVLAR